jgi:hypothetical protein
MTRRQTVIAMQRATVPNQVDAFIISSLFDQPGMDVGIISLQLGMYCRRPP